MTLVQGDDERGSGKSGSVIAFQLNPASGVPTFLQLVHQVEHALRLGYLTTGDRLPTVRDVVADLAINPNTVMKAYRELEHKGLASGRPGQGTFVTGTLSQAGLPQIAGLRRALQRWLADSANAGLDEDGMVALFSSTLRDFRQRGPVTEPRAEHGEPGDVAGGVA